MTSSSQVDAFTAGIEVPGGTRSSSNSIGDYLNAIGDLTKLFQSGKSSNTRGENPSYEDLLKITKPIREYVDERADMGYDDVRSALNEIKYGITGQAPAENLAGVMNVPGTIYDEGILRAYGASPFVPDYATPQSTAGFGDIKTKPTTRKLDRYIDRESPFRRQEIMDATYNPQIVSIDPSTYDSQLNKYLDAATLSKTYDYSDSATQGFLNLPSPGYTAPEEFKRTYDPSKTAYEAPEAYKRSYDPDQTGYKAPDQYSRESLRKFYGGDEAVKEYMTYSLY